MTKTLSIDPCRSEKRKGDGILFTKGRMLNLWQSYVKLCVFLFFDLRRIVRAN